MLAKFFVLRGAFHPCELRLNEGQNFADVGRDQGHSDRGGCKSVPTGASFPAPPRNTSRTTTLEPPATLPRTPLTKHRLNSRDGTETGGQALRLNGKHERSRLADEQRSLRADVDDMQSRLKGLEAGRPGQWVSAATAIASAVAAVAAVFVSLILLGETSQQTRIYKEQLKVQGPILNPSLNVVWWYESAGLSRGMYTPGLDGIERVLGPGDRENPSDVRMRLEVSNAGRADGAISELNVDGRPLTVHCGAEDLEEYVINVPCEMPITVNPSATRVMTVDMPYEFGCDGSHTPHLTMVTTSGEHIELAVDGVRIQPSTPCGESSTN